MAFPNNVFPGSGTIRSFLCLIIAVALMGLLFGLFFGAASLLVANQVGEKQTHNPHGNAMSSFLDAQINVRGHWRAKPPKTHI